MTSTAAAVAGDEAFVWEQKFKRAYRRMFALETAFCRRLLRHNAGPGPVCDCEECAWLRTLFAKDLADRLRTEHERTTPVDTDFATAARRQLEQLDQDHRAAEQTIVEATARRDAAKRDRDALEAALTAYERVRTKQSGGSTAAGPKALPAPGETREARSEPAVRPFLREWAAAHDGTIVVIQAAVGAVECGLYASQKRAQDNIGWTLRFHSTEYERVSRGVYRPRASAAA